MASFFAQANAFFAFEWTAQYQNMRALHRLKSIRVFWEKEAASSFTQAALRNLLDQVGTSSLGSPAV
jgi:hypothetical protein